MKGKLINVYECPICYGEEREFEIKIKASGEEACEFIKTLSPFEELEVIKKVRLNLCQPNDTIDGLTYAWKIIDDIKDKKVCIPPIRSSVVDDKLVGVLFGRYNKPKTEVIFNEPATILYKDGKKYVCKCDKEDKFSEELGLALCLLKSFGVSYSDFEELLKGAKRQGVKND
jgi:hypothetical protein